MNFNLSILRLKIMFYLLLGKIERVSPQIKLPNKESINNVVIVFPKDETDFRISMFKFKDFYIKKNNIIYFFLINQNFLEPFNLKKSNIFAVEYKKNQMKLCDNKNKKILLEQNFDVVVDLNTNFFFGCSKFISYLKSRIKIGFESNFSDIFYNLQLKSKKNGSTEQSFTRIKDILESL